MKKIEEKSRIIIFKTADEKISVDVFLENETVWLTIEQMAMLFEKSKSTINEHILNIYKEKELAEKETLRKIGISDFSTKPTNYYNLDVIISVGYRVKSLRGTEFRKWAPQRLKEYIIKGFVIDSERLKNLGRDFLRKLFLIFQKNENKNCFAFGGNFGRKRSVFEDGRENF